MGAFYIFKIVRIVPNRATHQNYKHDCCENEFLGNILQNVQSRNAVKEFSLQKPKYGLSFGTYFTIPGLSIVIYHHF